MAVTKDDLINNKPTSSGLLDFENGEGNVIDADLLDQNWTQNFTNILELYNFNIDQSPQLTETSTFTAEQIFSGGIKTDSIKEATTNSDILVDLDGTGLFKYKGTSAIHEVANLSAVDDRIANAGNITLPLTFGGIQTANFNSTKGFIYFIDSSSNSVTANLPASPSQGDVVGIVDFKGTSVNNDIFFGRNGNNIQDIAEDLQLNVRFRAIYLMYESTGGWYLI